VDLTSAVPGDIVATLLDAIVATNFDSVMVTERGDGATTPIIYVNRGFTELTGYGADEVLGRTPKFLQGPDTDRAVLDQLVADLTANRSFEGTTVNYRKDGTPFLMHWRVEPIFAGGDTPTHYLAVQREAPPA
jgi:PAS domain S-box-containing protein